MTTPILLRTLYLLAALAVGPLLAGSSPAAGAAAGAPDRDGEGGVRVELSAAGVVVGGHGAVALLALPAPAQSVSGGVPRPQFAPAVSPRVLTRPFDRVSYRTTGPPLRVC